jgi:hypothetical protein
MPEGMRPEGPRARVLDDEEFCRRLVELRRTRDFLLQEGVSANYAAIGLGSPFSLGQLNLIRFRRGGEPPTAEDWETLEFKQDALQRMFDAELQRRFRMRATQSIITRTPIFLLLMAGIALALAVFPPNINLFSAPDRTPVTTTQLGWQFGAYLFWTMSLGGLGAIGFLAVNSLAIQADATFDISNRALVAMRIVLGALFGSVISLPFCLPGFVQFAEAVAQGVDLDATRGALLLIPFLLGFSTPLVLAVLGRLVTGVETVFGIDRASQQRQLAMLQDSERTRVATSVQQAAAAARSEAVNAR